jgi:hypothetical protein
MTGCPARRSSMAFLTEISLEELLAEPMVVALMNQDGVSIDEARALYVSVGQRLKDNARDTRSRVIKPPCLPPRTAVGPDQLLQCM